MTMGVLALGLLGAVVGVCWPQTGRARVISAAVLALALGLVIAGTGGPLADGAAAVLGLLADLLGGVAGWVEG